MQYKRLTNDKKVRIEITTEGISEEMVKALEGRDWLRIFDTGSFTKLTKFRNNDAMNDIDVDGNDIIASVNYFLDWLSVEDRTVIMGYMTAINALLQDKVVDANPKVEELNVVCSKIGDLIYELNKRIGLFKKCKVFAETKLPLKINTDVVMRPQDTKETTYYYDDTILLAAASIFSKLLICIFGTIAEICKSHGIKQLNRDILNYLIVKPVYVDEIKPVMDKMKINTRSIIRQMYGGNNQRAQNRRYVLYGHGITESLLWTYVEAALPTRILINVTLYSDGINIVGFMYERVRQYVEAVLKTSEKNMIIERTDTSNYIDDQQRSTIELDSVTSRTPLDTLVLVDYIANSVVSRMVTQSSDINRKDFTICKDHLESQPVPYGHRNKLIIEVMFGKYIGGASSCSYIKHSTMIKMLAVIQLMLAKLGYKQLVYGLTAVTSSKLKQEPSSDDYRIIQSFSTKRSYREFTKLLETLPNKEFMIAEFAKRTSKVVASLTEEYSTYNIPQPVWDILGEENKNGKLIEYTSDYSDELCNLFIMEWQARKEVDEL